MSAAGGGQSGPFDKFTDAVCGEIMFRPAHRGVRAELTTHLEDRAEALAERGVPSEEAAVQAVAAMGDPKALGRALHRQHWPILGWIGLLWPTVVVLIVLLRCFITPHLPNTLYLRLAGVDPTQVVWSAHGNDSFGQFGVYITQEGRDYHFYRTGSASALGWLLSLEKAARVTCHVSYDTATGEITRYIETPLDCLVNYEEDMAAEHVHLRYQWTNFHPLAAGVYHMGLMPPDEIDPAWCRDLYQETETGLVLFAGFEDVARWSQSYPWNVPFYDYRLVD